MSTRNSDNFKTIEINMYITIYAVTLNILMKENTADLL